MRGMCGWYVNARNMGSGVRNLDSGVRNLDFGVRNLGLGVRNLDFSVRNLDFGVRNLDFGVRNLDFKTPRAKAEALAWPVPCFSVALCCVSGFLFVWNSSFFV